MPSYVAHPSIDAYIAGVPGVAAGDLPDAGAYLLRKSPDDPAALREALHERLGRPTGALTLGAVARAARARVPGPGRYWGND